MKKSVDKAENTLYINDCRDANTSIRCIRISARDSGTQAAIDTQSDMKNLDIKELNSRQSMIDLKRSAIEASGLLMPDAACEQWESRMWHLMGDTIKTRCEISLELIQHLNLDEESEGGKSIMLRIINFVKVGTFIKSNEKALAILDNTYMTVLQPPPSLDS